MDIEFQKCRYLVFISCFQFNEVADQKIRIYMMWGMWYIGWLLYRVSYFEVYPISLGFIWIYAMNIGFYAFQASLSVVSTSLHCYGLRLRSRRHSKVESYLHVIGTECGLCLRTTIRRRSNDVRAPSAATTPTTTSAPQQSPLVPPSLPADTDDASITSGG